MKVMLPILMFAAFSLGLVLINQAPNLETTTSGSTIIIDSNIETDNSNDIKELARKRPGRCCMG